MSACGKDFADIRELTPTKSLVTCADCRVLIPMKQLIGDDDVRIGELVTT